METARPEAKPAERRPRARGVADAGGIGSRRGATPLLVAVLLLLHLAPIWVFDYFPSQDGPSHVYNAKLIQEYGHPERASFRDYYEISIRPIPNLLGHVVLAGLLSAAPPRTAERLFLSIYVILLVGSVLYGLRALRPEPSVAWLLPFPLVYSYALHMGFYNFSLGVPISILAIGYVRASRDRFGIRETYRLALVLLFLYFAHLLSLVLALLAIGVLCAWRVQRAAAAAADGAAATDVPLGDALRRHAFMPLLACAPAAALAASYVLRGHLLASVASVGALLALCAGAAAAASAVARGPAVARRWTHALLRSRVLVPLAAGLPALLVLALVHVGPPLLGPVARGPALTHRLWEFWGTDALVAYSDAERPLALAAAGLLVGAAFYLPVAAIARRRSPAGDGMGWVVLAFAALYFVMPDGLLGGGHVLPRIALYALLAAVLWLGDPRFPAPLERTVTIGAVAVAVALLALRASIYAGFDRQLREYASAAAPIEHGATLLALAYAPYGLARDGARPSTRVRPLMHAAGLIAARKGLVLLNNYEATMPDFPVRYRTGLDPTPHLGEVFYPRGRPISLPTYPERTGGRIDYVLVWGLHDDDAPDPMTTATLAQLDAAFDRVPTPSGSTHARLYRHRPPPPAK